MSAETLNKLKKMIEEKGAITQEDIDTVEKEHGKLSGAEHMELEAFKLEKAKGKRTEVTMEQYLEASKILDTALEGSPEYKAAEAIVNAFEGGG